MKQWSSKAISILLVLMIGLGFLALPGVTRAHGPVVQAVLFFSPTCGHCHKVIGEDLPPLVEQYQDQLQILMVDVSQELGQQLYQSALAAYNVPDERIGVPTLIVGDAYLVGSVEIPEQFPGLIETGLANGGIELPDIPGLEEAIQSQETITGEDPDHNEAADPSTQETEPVPTRLEIAAERFAMDKTANSIAVIVLIGMIASVFGVGISFTSDTRTQSRSWPAVSVPVLAVIGLFVAAYLTYIETNQANAICGPIGDCNSVQQSPYATLFGIIPVGILGIVGYTGILGAWVIQRYGSGSVRRYASLAVWGMAWLGLFFSIYLTFLEPFVIGATCMWCITSAIVMTLLLWASTGDAKEALEVDDLDEYDEEELDEDQFQLIRE